jgi:alcohol dehydrogenase
MPHVRELAFIRSGNLAWRDRDAPILRDPGDAIVRPFIAARCDGDTVPIHRPVSRLMQAGYDVVVEASSRAAGLRRAIRSLARGGVCTAVGYYLATGTRVPLMHMYATDATLRVGVSHARAVLPDLLAFVARTRFPADQVATLTAHWEDAPTAYATRTTKLVLQRDAV